MLGSNLIEMLRRTYEKERKEGFQEGLQEARLELAMEIAGRLLDMGMPLEQVVYAVQLPEEEVRKLRVQ